MRQLLAGMILAIGWVGLVSQSATQAQESCPTPALSRVVKHRVVAGETLEKLADRYRLIPATLMGLNPSLQDGKVTVGSDILVPPINGIRVEIPSGQTFRDVAKKYNVRPDVLFEANGCQRNPRVVFVPGVNWSPIDAPGVRKPTASERSIVSSYPLGVKPTRSAVLLGYGWRVQAATGKVVFHSGVDLAAPLNTSVVAAGDGTVAFAGKQGAYGNLVVINHANGLQTRYAQLAALKVKTGQTVKRGQTIATVGTTGTPSSPEPHLHFEVRVRSNLGWVADNPEPYVLRNAAIATQN